MSKIILSHEYMENIHPYIYAYLGQNPDINSMHSEKDAGVYGIYNCVLTPVLDIGVLEVIPYSGDWCMQRFTKIADVGHAHCWVRFYFGGNTWSKWDLIW